MEDEACRVPAALHPASLPPNVMRLHVARRLPCSCAARRGRLRGPSGEQLRARPGGEVLRRRPGGEEPAAVFRRPPPKPPAAGRVLPMRRARHTGAEAAASSPRP